MRPNKSTDNLIETYSSDEAVNLSTRPKGKSAFTANSGASSSVASTPQKKSVVIGVAADVHHDCNVQMVKSIKTTPSNIPVPLPRKGFLKESKFSENPKNKQLNREDIIELVSSAESSSEKLQVSTKTNVQEFSANESDAQFFTKSRKNTIINIEENVGDDKSMAADATESVLQSKASTIINIDEDIKSPKKSLPRNSHKNIKSTKLLVRQKIEKAKVENRDSDEDESFSKSTDVSNLQSSSSASELNSDDDDETSAECSSTHKQPKMHFLHKSKESLTSLTTKHDVKMTTRRNHPNKNRRNRKSKNTLETSFLVDYTYEKLIGMIFILFNSVGF